MAAPGPAALGRGVVIEQGGAIPAPWVAAPVVTVDDSVLRDPTAAIDRLHRAWSRREAVVIELAVEPAGFREPVSVAIAPWQLDTAFVPWADRLHFLVWANTYDARSGDPIWWWGRKAARLGAEATPHGPADIILSDGSGAWVDGGPRRPFSSEDLGPPDLADVGLIHTDSVQLGELRVTAGPVEPNASLAEDQLAAVAHLSGPARVIAPAGSGKTRVLTERLRHLVADRGWEVEGVLAVAYNKEAQLEMERRTTAFRPRVRTLNSLGLWVLRLHRGSAPVLVDERDCRRLVESLLPGRRQRRANTDPIGPYLEGLASIRLGLRDPEEVEASRDDVDGLAEMFDLYRSALTGRGAIDFDEQIYSAIEVLLADGPFRRSVQARCRHLLVDEFQDLTPAHILLLRLLAAPGFDVFGVGDDDQVIYGHAGADPGFLIDYDRYFPGAADHRLTVNYRCPEAVVEGARTLLGYNLRRLPKEIVAADTADPARDALRVVEHATDQAAASIVDVVERWMQSEDTQASSIAVLARVNSLLLAPHVALAEAGIPLSSTMSPRVLERTGMRAALAYLRIAAAADRIDARDIVEVLRRPTRGLPPWFPDRLEARVTWSPSQVRGIAKQVATKEASKVERLASDLAAVVAAARSGTTRDVLEVVRDHVGLGTAMTLLDRTGGGQGSSHLDDLEALLEVADLHPDVAGFETWLRSVVSAPGDAGGVTLSTIHRVKGREWTHVAVFGVNEGIVPHRLADDLEEERRVLHVGITRGAERVAVLSDRDRASPFLSEMAGTAPRPRAGSRQVPGAGAAATARPASKVAKKGAPVEGIEAARGLSIAVLGGYRGTVDEVDARGARIRLDDGGSLTVRFGERVEHEGRRAPLVVPSELWGPAADAEVLLRAWRTDRARSAAKPAYTVLSDAHLRGIALARPRSAEELLACDGIGPTKLDRYGDDLLALLDQVD